MSDSLPLGQSRSVTAAEKRALKALAESIESWGHPAFSSGGAGGRYIVTGRRKVPGIGTITENTQVRRTTMNGLREKGLVDASWCPTEAGLAVIGAFHA